MEENKENTNTIEQIKEIVSRIDLEPINKFLESGGHSTTAKEIIKKHGYIQTGTKYISVGKDSKQTEIKDEAEYIKIAKHLAENISWIINANEVIPKEDEEKWIELANELGAFCGKTYKILPAEKKQIVVRQREEEKKIKEAKQKVLRIEREKEQFFCLCKQCGSEIAPWKNDSSYILIDELLKNHTHQNFSETIRKSISKIDVEVLEKWQTEEPKIKKIFDRTKANIEVANNPNSSFVSLVEKGRTLISDLNVFFQSKPVEKDELEEAKARGAAKELNLILNNLESLKEQYKVEKKKQSKLESKSKQNPVDKFKERQQKSQQLNKTPQKPPKAEDKTQTKSIEFKDEPKLEPKITAEEDTTIFLKEEVDAEIVDKERKWEEFQKEFKINEKFFKLRNISSGLRICATCKQRTEIIYKDLTKEKDVNICRDCLPDRQYFLEGQQTKTDFTSSWQTCSYCKNNKIRATVRSFEGELIKMCEKHFEIKFKSKEFEGLFFNMK